MALIRGSLVSYAAADLPRPPVIVRFQYNPEQFTRVFRHGGAGADGVGKEAYALSTAGPAAEEWSFKIELDATDALEKGPGAALTFGFGLAPQLAALEMLMRPVGKLFETHLGLGAGDAVGGLGGRVGTDAPRYQLPLVLLVWGPNRVAPVRVNSLSITETAFDELLNPVRASADLGVTVLRPEQVASTDRFARAAALRYLRGTADIAGYAPNQQAELARTSDLVPFGGLAARLAPGTGGAR